MAAASWTLPAISDEQRIQFEEELRRRDLPPRTRERLQMIKASTVGHTLETAPHPQYHLGFSP
jgi:hypothetical protein